MMDCKHEDDSLPRSEMAYCDDCKDPVWISDDDYVILSKAQHQLREDVVKAGEKVSEAWKTWKADKGFRGYSELSDALDDFAVNVDALDKRNNERGL